MACYPTTSNASETGSASRPFTVVRGLDFAISGAATDHNGIPYNLSGRTGLAELRVNPSDTVAVGAMTVVVLSAASGLFELSLTDAQTTALPLGSLTVSARFSNGAGSTVGSGFVYLRVI